MRILVCTCGQQGIQNRFCLGCLKGVCRGEHVETLELPWGMGLVHTGCLSLVPASCLTGTESPYVADSTEWQLISKDMEYGSIPTMIRLIKTLSALPWGSNTDMLIHELEEFLASEREILGLLRLAFLFKHGLDHEVDYIRHELRRLLEALKKAFPQPEDVSPTIGHSPAHMGKAFVNLLQAIEWPEAAKDKALAVRAFFTFPPDAGAFLDCCVMLAQANNPLNGYRTVMAAIYDEAATWAKESKGEQS